MRSIQILLLASLAAASHALAGVRVVTSNTLLADLARQLAQPGDSVRSLVAPGNDPHAYQPTPGDVRGMADADVLVVNGLGLEPWFERLAASSGGHAALVEASHGIAPLQADGRACASDHDHDDHDHGEIDPHAWQDLSNVIQYVENIARALEQAAPASTAGYRTAAKDLEKCIRELDTEARMRMASIPEARRILVTSHDSFAYFGRAYGLRIETVSGLRPDREPSARQLGALVERIRGLRGPAIFIESTSNPKLPRLLADESQVRVVTTLYTDSVGEPGTPAGTFLGMFRANLDTIESALKD